MGSSISYTAAVAQDCANGDHAPFHAPGTPCPICTTEPGPMMKHLRLVRKSTLYPIGQAGDTAIQLSAKLKIAERALEQRAVQVDGLQNENKELAYQNKELRRQLQMHMQLFKVALANYEHLGSVQATTKAAVEAGCVFKPKVLSTSPSSKGKQRPFDPEKHTIVVHDGDADVDVADDERD